MRIHAAIYILAFALTVQAQDTIHVQTRLVEVDVVVRKQGGALTGLAKDDFSLVDNGKPRKIDVFANLGKASSASKGAAEQTTTVVLLDRLNTGLTYQPYANQQLSKFLQSLWSGEKMAIYSLDDTLHVIQDFTTDSKQLNAATAALSPRPAYVDGPAARARGAMEAWTTIAHRLADTPGRKNLIWLSGGFPLCIPSRSVQGTTDCFDAEVENAARSLNDARVAVYPVDARALLPRRGPLGLSVFDTFNRIARLTGGAAFYNTNGVKEAIREAMDDSGAVYTLGFYVTDAEMDGAFHPLKVNVSAKDVELRYRSGYFATKDSTLTPEQRFASLTDAIYGPLLPAGVRLQATAAADPDRPGAYRVEVSINANDLHWDRLEHVWRAEFASASIWEPDAPSQVATEPVEVHLTDDRFHEVAKTGLVWTTSVSPGAKAKSLRIVIQDQATGLVGAALVPLKQK